MKRLLFMIFFTGSISGQHAISKIYSHLLGKQDVRQEYKDRVHQALREFGVKDPEHVLVKKMNKVGYVFALMPVSSFTTYGIWFDEEYLDSCSPEERLFQIYHEAAHYAYHHHQKLLGTMVLLSPAVIAGLVYLHKYLKEKNNPYSLTITMVTSLFAVAVIYLGILPKIIKGQEKQADIEGAKKLILSGRQNVVAHKISSLKSQSSSGQLWWPSCTEQIAYLGMLLKKI